MSESGIFKAAVQLPPEKRAAYLDQACGENAELRQEVESLLRAHDQADSFLCRPAARPPATVDEEPIAEGPGTVIGPYKLLQQIGEGGMGVVYMAEQQEPVRRKVALMIIKPGMDSRQVIARFEAERQALALMDHLNIAKVLDAGTTATGRPYFVMELVHGIPITEYCDDHKLAPRQRLELFIPVCHAAQHAHQKGIIHRDLKPSNILVTMYDDKPVPKVIDFGVAKAIEQRLTEKTLFTQFGTMVGTFEYMSPEQAELNAFGVDTRSDIYSLGVLLYELLTGTTPLERQRLRQATYREIIRLIKEEEPMRPSQRISTSGDRLPELSQQRSTDPHRLSKLIRGELDWIVMKCLEKDRTRRYETANGLARDVERYLKDEPVEACPPSVGYRLRKVYRKNRVALLTAAGFVGLLVAGVIGTTVGLFEAQFQRGAAEQEAQSARAAAERADQETERAKAEEAKARRLAGFAAVAEGVRIADQGDVRGGLLWFAEAERQNPNDAGFVAANRIRFAAYRRHHPGTPPGFHLFDGGIWVAAVSPDGKRFAARMTAGKAVRIWDAENGQPLTAPLEHASYVYGVQFSLDSRRLLTWDEQAARVWDVASGKPLTPPLLASAGIGVPKAEISADGRYVLTTSQLTGANSHVVRLWDADNGKQVGEIITEPTWAVVYPATLSPRQRYVMTIGKNTARIWDAATGKLVSNLAPRESALRGADILRASFSPDGTRVLTTGGYEWVVWDAAKGVPLARAEHRGKHAHYSLDAGRFSPDGTRVLTTDAIGVARLWDAATGRPVSPLLQSRTWSYRAQSAEFSPDGRSVLVVGPDSTTQVWDTRTWTLRHPPITHPGSGVSARFSPDGRRFVTVSQAKVARIWDTRTGKPLSALIPQPGGLRHALFHPDGRRLYTCDDAGLVRLWDPATDVCMPPVVPVATPEVTVHGFSADASRVVTQVDAGFQVWDITAGRPVGKLLTDLKDVMAASISPDGGRLAVYGRKTVQVCDATTGQTLTPPIETEFSLRLGTPSTACVVFSPAGDQVLTIGSQRARLWNAVTGQPVGPVLTFAGVPGQVAFSPAEDRLAIGTGVSRAALWDLTQPEKRIELKHRQYTYAVAFSPDGSRVATGSDDRTARIWDAATGHPITSELDHPDKVHAVQFGPGGRRLVTGCDDGAARVWDATSGKLLAPPMSHSRPVTAVALSPEGRLLVAGCKDGSARVWDASTGLPVTPTLQLTGSVVLVRFSPAGQRVFVGCDNASGRWWDLSPDERPADDLLQLAELWALHRIDPAVGTTPLSVADARSRYEQLQSKYPADFAPPTREQIRAWHTAEADAAERDGDWFGAAFHVRILFAETPDDPALQARLATAQAKQDADKELPPQKGSIGGKGPAAWPFLRVLPGR